MAEEFILSNVACLDAAKSPHPISTGIGFLDHMIDQLNSHAQVGVSVTVNKNDATECGGGSVADNDKKRLKLDNGNGCSGVSKNSFVNRHEEEDQGRIMSAVGAALGAELGKLISNSEGGRAAARVSRFCCPLDEALVECVLARKANGGGMTGRLAQFTLPPYGKYPLNKGRSKIGSMETEHVETFFANLAQSSGMDISLNKLRGDNGHHVVESAFKAFSRALRNLLDGTNTNECSGERFESMWGAKSESHKCGLELRREGKVERSTKETSISVHLLLDGHASKGLGESVSVDTGINTVNEFVSILATEARMSVDATCSGDLYVDDHHTSEDVSIALGQVLDKAFGTKAGLNRMWCATGTYGDAEVEVTMDLSNRPCVTHDLSLSSNPNDEEYAGDLSVEMLDHVIESLVMNSRSTVHIVERSAGKTVLETALALATAYGRALRMCAAVDPRRAGKTASSKGTLSV